MPIYEYRCPKCGRRSSRVWLKFPSPAEERAQTCPACGAGGLARVFSRFASPKSEERRIDSMVDDPALSGLDENDPRGMARFMRRMSEEAGEPLEGDDREMLERMESGEMPADEGDAAAGSGSPAS